MTDNRKRRIQSAYERDNQPPSRQAESEEDEDQDTNDQEPLPEHPLSYYDPLEEEDFEIEDDGDVLRHQSQEDEDDPGEDLFGDDMENDYKEMPHLDIYSSSQLDDDTEYAPMPLDSRLAVDAQLDRRDRDILRRQSRIPEMFLPSSSSDVDLAHAGLGRMRSRRAARQLMADGRHSENEEDGNQDDGEMVEFPSDDKSYSLKEFVMLESCRRKVSRDYRTFLTTYLDAAGHSYYSAKIKQMCASNEESLEVSFVHLAESNAFLARLVASCPREALNIFDDATLKVVLEQFPEYHRIKSDIHVRMVDLPTADPLRDLRYTHLNSLVRVSGVVTRRSGVFPQLKLVKMDCGRCGAILGPFTQDLNSELRLSTCSVCQSKGPFHVNETQTVYRNYQKITLQESPGSVPAGRLPRHKEVILLWDLIDSVRPGEEVEIIGIYTNNYSYALNTKHGFPVFATIIEANAIKKKENEFAMNRLSEDDQKEIRKLAEDPMIAQRIIQSIAPSIYGHETIKTAIALAMFGGQSKMLQGKMRLRGDINVLMLGDPGTAKSQFLKYVEKTAHRAIYTTGQGASAVGLTASVRKDPATREWTLEGGALVLADKGICLIDEFDKMNDADRTSIHEAMEQQSISISKAGIVTSLQARCSVIAAANPIRGRYNASLPFSGNVDLSEPILSRFDVLCVVKDVVDPEQDARLATFVVQSHRACMGRSTQPPPSSTNGQEGDPSLPSILSQDTLRKYILYAKSKVFPAIRSSVDSEKIARLYSELRKESLMSGGIPMTVRHVESMVRMAEAHARMHLREDVLPMDIDVAVRLMLESFISSQKLSVTKRLTRTFSRYITTGRDAFYLLFHVLSEVIRETVSYYQYRYSPSQMPSVLSVDVSVVSGRAKELHCGEAVGIWLKSGSFASKGYRFNEAKGTIEMDNPIKTN